MKHNHRVLHIQCLIGLTRQVLVKRSATWAGKFHDYAGWYLGILRHSEVSMNDSAIVEE